MRSLVMMVVAASSFVYGCAGYFVTYPEDWAPPVEPREDCSAIAGVYDNTGVLVEATNLMIPIIESTRVFLSPSLIPRGRALPGQVEIVIDDKRMDVTATYLDGWVEKKEYSAEKGDFECDRGKVEIDEWGHMVGPFVPIAVGHDSVTFSKATDDALVVSVHSVAGGLPMFLPVVAGGRSYLRFASYDPEEGAKIETILHSEKSRFIAVKGQVSAITVTPKALWGVSARPTSGGLPRNGIFKVDLETGQPDNLYAIGGFSQAKIAAGFGAVWVAEGIGGGKIYRLDPANDSIVATIPIAGNPNGIAAGEGAVWVSSSWSTGKFLDVSGRAIYRIDPETNYIVNTIPIPQGKRPSTFFNPSCIQSARAMLALSNNAVWTGDAWHGTVQRIDPETNRIVATIPAPKPETAEGCRHEYSIMADGETLLLVRRVYTERSWGEGGRVEQATIWRIDTHTNQFVGDPVQVDKKDFVFALADGSVWIGSASEDVLTKGDPQTFLPVGKPWRIGYPVYSLAAGEGVVWAVGGNSPYGGGIPDESWLTRLTP